MTIKEKYAQKVEEAKKAIVKQKLIGYEDCKYSFVEDMERGTLVELTGILRPDITPLSLLKDNGTKIVIPDFVSCVNRLFDYKNPVINQITEIVLPKDCVNLGYAAFSNMSNLREINLDVVTDIIGSGCFAFCTNLEKISLQGVFLLYIKKVPDFL